MSITTLGPQDVECTVLTFREGLLSPVGHDLKLRVEKLRVEIAEARDRVEAFLDARSIVVVCAMHGDQEKPDALSASDRRDIEARLHKEILEVSRYPEIGFRSSSIEHRDLETVVRGDLTIRGITRSISLSFRPIDGASPSPSRDRTSCAEVAIRQTDLGLKPYRAMLGTLRVRDDVTVRVLARPAALAPAAG
ncbi:MAG: YceI family protein [Deltaproteobacteria bacterium]|nr:YceI family protein [Deltaproteobacteria bacterium]